MESFDPVTPQGLSISNLFVLELVISGLLMALVSIWLGVSLVRFRARPGDTTEPPQVHGNRTLEIIWTVTPAAVLAVVLWGGYSGRMSWTGINGHTATVWDWLHLLLLPAAFALLPLTLSRRAGLTRRHKSLVTAAAVAFALLVLFG